MAYTLCGFGVDDGSVDIVALCLLSRVTCKNRCTHVGEPT